MSQRFVCFLFVLSACFSTAYAQIIDSTQSVVNKQTKEPKEKKEKEQTIVKNHNPTTATIMSAAVPGLGQVYNRKYWKVPIIYGLGGLFVYNIVTSNSYYTDYRDALYERQERAACKECLTADKQPIDQFVGVYSDSQLQTRKNFYKRRRDFNIIYSLLLYTANILDAAVDAHLINFNVGEQYIMSLEPTFINTTSVSNSIGLSLTVNFK